ncbi:phosphoglucomutase [Alkaliphilus sp. B6464]|uniref:phosphoglucomutase n=1 Tax=Alkaliphilus sp. B6464 TaxID=2731219 RepID=UPI001BA77ED7|nr:phosphoglucomutase [Alkaliphilus sp. B6464]QUH21412.1 phosphoglucomutase [Alkaliphilus sp. B6464]
MFVEKLNKKPSGVYIIEEEKDIVNGIWEGFLDHDNVNHQSISIYTEPKFTGEKVDNYFISTPSETPWKTHLKVFSKSEKIYIVYETTGDQVEAEDINSINQRFDDYRENGVIDGGYFIRDGDM